MKVKAHKIDKTKNILGNLPSLIWCISACAATTNKTAVMASVVETYTF